MGQPPRNAGVWPVRGSPAGASAVRRQNQQRGRRGQFGSSIFWARRIEPSELVCGNRGGRLPVALVAAVASRLPHSCRSFPRYRSGHVRACS
jgi:hypothetical protein